MISISDYKATNNDEIDALKGDIISRSILYLLKNILNFKYLKSKN